MKYASTHEKSLSGVAAAIGIGYACLASAETLQQMAASLGHTVRKIAESTVNIASLQGHFPGAVAPLSRRAAPNANTAGRGGGVLQ
jgi:hypothetical protein